MGFNVRRKWRAIYTKEDDTVWEIEVIAYTLWVAAHRAVKAANIDARQLISIEEIAGNE